jgi:hypothetical protein
MEQLALARRRLGADLVQAGAAYTAGEDKIGGGLDDPGARRHTSRS